MPLNNSLLNTHPPSVKQSREKNQENRILKVIYVRAHLHREK